MNCSNCGAEIKNGATVCAECGAQIVSEENTAVKYNFTFNKKKQLGNLTYKETITTAAVSDSTAEIEQTVKKFIGGEKKTNASIPLGEISSVLIKVKFDFWDTLYAVLFAVLGIFAPIAFLGTAVCLFCAFGKEIIITTSKTVVRIPLTGFGSTDEALKFINACKGNK